MFVNNLRRVGRRTEKDFESARYHDIITIHF